MSKAVLISIRPEWCSKIASGKKTIEVRKTRPKLQTPFKCYIYCTNSELLTRSHYDGRIYVSTSRKYKKALEESGNKTLSGTVIGEFVCAKIDTVEVNSTLSEHPRLQKETCLSELELVEYLSGAAGYAWHISELQIYDTPKELMEFFKPCSSSCNYIGECGGTNAERCFFPMERPPQSWCYVEELT